MFVGGGDAIDGGDGGILEGRGLDEDAKLKQDVHGEAGVAWIAGVIFEPLGEGLSAVEALEPCAPSGGEVFLLKLLPAHRVDLDAHIGLERWGGFAENLEPRRIEGLDLRAREGAQGFAGGIKESVVLDGVLEPRLGEALERVGRGFLRAIEQGLQAVIVEFIELLEEFGLVLCNAIAEEDKDGLVFVKKREGLAVIEEDAGMITLFFKGFVELVAAFILIVEQPDLAAVIDGSSPRFGGMCAAQEEAALRPAFERIKRGLDMLVLVVYTRDLSRVDVDSDTMIRRIQEQDSILLCLRGGL